MEIQRNNVDMRKKIIPPPHGMSEENYTLLMKIIKQDDTDFLQFCEKIRTQLSAYFPDLSLDALLILSSHMQYRYDQFESEIQEGGIHEIQDVLDTVYNALFFMEGVMILAEAKEGIKFMNTGALRKKKK